MSATIKISKPFKEKIIRQAKIMLEGGILEQVFSDENKQFDGMTIYIRTSDELKPTSTLFQFQFPDDFPSGKGKTIYVGNDKP